MVINSYGSDRILEFLERLGSIWKFTDGEDRPPTTEDVVYVISGLNNLLEENPINRVASVENILLVKEDKATSIYIKVGEID